MFIIPPINTALTPNYWANRTKKGAPIFPRFDIASLMPIPVDLIDVGKLSEQIRLNNANPTVLNSLLRQRNTSYTVELVLVN